MQNPQMAEEEEFEFELERERELAADPSSFKIGDVPGGSLLSYAGDMLKNAPGSALRLAGGIAMAPITVPMALGRAVSDIGQAAMGDRGPLGETAAAIGGHFKQRYGGLSNLAESVRTDLFGVAADVLPLATGAFGGLKKLGVPSASFMEQKLSRFDPTRLGLAAAESALGGAGQRLKRRAITSYEKASGFEPTSSDNPLWNAAEKSKAAKAGLEAGLTISPVPSKVSLQERATTGATGTLTGDLWGNLQKLWGKSPTIVNAQSLRYLPPETVNKSVHKMAILEAKANEDIASVIGGLESSGYNLSKAGREQLAQQAADHMLKNISATPEIVSLVEEMQKFEGKVPLTHPDLSTGHMITDITTPKQMQQRKQTLRAGQGFGESALGKKLTDTKLSDAFQKAMAHQLMIKLEEWAPELKGLNETSAGRKVMMDALGQYVNGINKGATLASKAWAVGRIGGAGVGGAAAAGPSGAAVAILAAYGLGRPSVRTAVARGLYQASKVSERASKMAGAVRSLPPGLPEVVTGIQRYGVEGSQEVR